MWLITVNPQFNKRGNYFSTQDQVGLDNFSCLISENIIENCILYLLSLSLSNVKKCLMIEKKCKCVKYAKDH